MLWKEIRRHYVHIMELDIRYNWPTVYTLDTTFLSSVRYAAESHYRQDRFLYNPLPWGLPTCTSRNNNKTT